MVELVDTSDSKSFVLGHTGSNPVRSKYFVMIQAQTVLRIVDNSGGKKARCIKVKGKKSSTARLGDIILVSVQSLRPRYKSQVKTRVQKSEIHYAVVVQTKSRYRLSDGRFLYFGHNSAVLITTKKKLLGTRISTHLPRILRGLGWGRLGILAKGLV